MANDVQPRIPLARLARPKFHAGQLLTADVLTDLADWTRNRLDLGRWGNGWGVLEGLVVTCGAEGPLSLGISPGYAVDRFGRDIVVPEPQTLALELDAAVKDKLDEQSAYSQALPGIFQLAIAIEYTSRDTDPKPLAFLTDQKKTRDCVYTRSDEGFRIVVVADDETSRKSGEIEAYENKFVDTLRIVDDFNNRFSDGNQVPAADLKEFMTEQIERQALGFFAHVDQTIETWSQKEQVPRNEALEVLFWIVQDRRLRLTRSLASISGSVNTIRIRLATIRLLAVRDGAGKLIANFVQVVDSTLAARDEFKRSASVLDDGRFDIADLLWLPVNIADAAMREYGIVARRFRKQDPKDFPNVEDLKRVLQFPRFAGPWTSPTVHYVHDSDNVPRVAGFDFDPNIGLCGVAVRRESVPLLRLGQEVELTYIVENIGRAGLRVDVEDDLHSGRAASVARDQEIDAGETKMLAKTYRVPADPTEFSAAEGRGVLNIPSTVTARAKEIGGGEKEIIDQYNATLKVDLPLALEVKLTTATKHDGTAENAKIRIQYTVDLLNQSKQSLQVDVRLFDSLDGHDFDSLELAPRQGRELTHQGQERDAFKVGSAVSRVVATARAEDGRTLIMEAAQTTMWAATPSEPTTWGHLLCVIWRFLVRLFGK